MSRGCFNNCKSLTSNVMTGSFGISGFCINCIANYDSARIDFYMGKSDAAKNKAAFDLLYSHKAEIEEELQVPLIWERADKYKASWLSYQLNDVSITNEADWGRMAKFHAEWSDKICNVVLSYLQDEDSDSVRLIEIAGILREWTVECKHVHENLAKCNRTLTRFTTDGMSAILPDLSGAPSGWNTDNHYFYEIVNRTGKNVYIQFCISSHNASENFLAICNRINEYYPSKFDKEAWLWRTPFKTSSVEIGDSFSKEEIFAKLDACLREIQVFEADLKQKLQAEASQEIKLN